MKIWLPTISYDRFWHQIVIGLGQWEYSKYQKGQVYWRRLFGIGKMWNKEFEERNNNSRCVQQLPFEERQCEICSIGLCKYRRTKQ